MHHVTKQNHNKDEEHKHQTVTSKVFGSLSGLFYNPLAHHAVVPAKQKTDFNGVDEEKTDPSMSSE